MAKYLVTGGAGFLGVNLIRYLLRREHDVISFDIVPFEYPEKDAIFSIKGDVREQNELVDAMKDASVVVHCAAALPSYPNEDIYSTEVAGTRNVLETAFKIQIERVIHISSTAVYGIFNHCMIREDNKLDGSGEYGKAKILAEAICEEYRRKGMCVAIVRPKTFVGPERLGIFGLLYEWAMEGRSFPLIGTGKNYYQLLDVEDLCEAIYLLSKGDRSLVNDTFNIGAKRFGTLMEDFQAVLDYAGFGKKIKIFPATPVVWMLRILEYLRLSPIYGWVYETVCTDSYVSIEKAERVLGFQPKYSNKEALLRNFQWYLENVEQFRGRTGISHRLPWSEGIMRVVKWLF